MLEFFIQYQNEILFGCGIVNLMLAFFVLVIKFHSIRKKLALLKIELSVAVLTICVSLAFHFDGYQGTMAYWVLRVSNCATYLALLCSLYFVCEYVTALFMETGKFAKLPKRLLLGFIIPAVGMSLVLLNLATEMYYKIGADNVYVRGPLFWLSFVFPFVTIFLLFSFTLQYRKYIKRDLRASLVFFSVLPMVAGIVQLISYGYPLTEFASWIASVTLFWFALSGQNDELSIAANTDLVTGLVNTYGFIYEAERIINYHNITEYTAFYFDISRMSYINNKYGKNAGDEIILKYSHNFKAELEKDEILGRLGGNFFIALIRNTNVEKFLNMLRDMPVEIDFEGHKEVVHLSSVAGVYEIKKKNIAGAQLITNTSIAVNYAKNVVHKPYVFLDEELMKEFDHIRTMEEKCRKGLANDEFEPFYQPKVNTRDNTLCGAEALARWRNNGKLVPPYEFISVMEKNGTICDLDFYILERVCKDIKDWIERGLDPVRVSVNFSRKNLGNPILSEAISKVVEKYDIPKELVQIEVTETIDEFPMSYLIGVVEALQRYGMTVAIDDFGTGSSSIRMLKDVKFDILKIDKSFVDYSNDKDKTLLSDIINMARNREISVIAEGVEENDQVEALKDMSCFAIQGYVFDKPLDKAEYEKRLMSRNY